MIVENILIEYPKGYTEVYKKPIATSEGNSLLLLTVLKLIQCQDYRIELCIMAQAIATFKLFRKMLRSDQDSYFKN